MKKILIVDNDPEICLSMKNFFHQNGYKPYAVSSGNEAVSLMQSIGVDLVICESRLSDYNAVEMLQKIKILNPTIPVLIISAYQDVKIAIKTVRNGAIDYIMKPLYMNEILASVQNILAKKGSMDKDKSGGGSTDSEEIIIGTSYQSQLVNKHVELIAPTNMSVIIMGDSGTGKEYVARDIHTKSQRRHKPFIAVDCGALPEDLAGSELFGHTKGAFTGAINNKRGCFEIAHGGTLFLDEIGNLSFENQTKLLRVLQERRVKRIGSEEFRNVDVRLIVATNEDLKAAINSGDFREDIFHRLNEFIIELTPIRERPEDIELFSFHFLKLANSQLNKSIKGFEKNVMQIFQNYTWHGNLRELKNVIKRAVLFSSGPKIDIRSLPPELSSKDTNDDSTVDLNVKGTIKSLKEAIREAEKGIIVEVLKQTGNNKTRAAEILKIDRKTLYNKLKLHRIKL